MLGTVIMIAALRVRRIMFDYLRVCLKSIFEDLQSGGNSSKMICVQLQQSGGLLVFGTGAAGRDT